MTTLRITHPPRTIKITGSRKEEDYLSETAEFLKIISTGGPFEVRLLKCTYEHRKTYTVAGYWDDPRAAAEAVYKADEDHRPRGCYVTLNPINPALQARAQNRFEEYPENTTGDNDILARRCLLLDFDPVRPANISSTDEELALAQERAQKVRTWLSKEFAWPDPIAVVASGNGYHLIYAIDLPNDAESTALVKNLLRAIAGKFSNAKITVDESVFNAARITKLPGTWVCKGDNTKERPWRRARLVRRSKKRLQVPRAKLEAVAALAEESVVSPSGNKSAAETRTKKQPGNVTWCGSRLSVPQYLSHYGVAARKIDGVDDKGRDRWAFKECPFHPDHGGKDCILFQDPEGKLGFHCFHARCADKTWQDLKATIGPPLPEHYDPPLADISFRNFDRVLRAAEEGRGRVTLMGRSVAHIASDLYERTGGWPKRVGSALFCPSANRQPLWLTSPTELFAWIDGQCRVDWQRGSDQITQERFFAYLQMTAEAFEGVETVPHWPPMPEVYYMHPELPESDGTYLTQLVDRFQPATALDRELIRAFVLSLFWGGKPGTRPAWLFTGPTSDAQRGRGVGKSTLADVLSQLAGGLIEVSPQEDIAKIKTRLLSPGTRQLRVARLDNVKTHRFSWADLEGLITSPVISGHQMYQGEGRRPNTLTWVLTLNGASLSTDMAQRCMIVRLARPTHSAAWEAETRRFIAEQRWQIIADAIGMLKK